MGLIERIVDAVEKRENNNKFATNSLKKNGISFDSELAITNPVRFIFKYANSDVIDNAINQNAKIKFILKENKLPVDYDLDNVTSIITSHLVPTARLVAKIYNKLNRPNDKNEYLHLVQSALIHDIGKVFVPKSILNKAGKLTSSERQIVELHNKFSYEIIKTTDLDNDVARLAKEHHNYDHNLKRTPLNQTLTVADIYCALREKRPYKKAIDDISAKAILYDMAANGSFDISYIQYLW